MKNEEGEWDGTTPHPDMITAEHFKKRTGRKPTQDDLQRANCPIRGTGHYGCGWCGFHDKPIFTGCCTQEKLV